MQSMPYVFSMCLVWRTALIITTEWGQRKRQIATFRGLFVLHNQQLSFSIHAACVNVCTCIDKQSLTHAADTHRANWIPAHFTRWNIHESLSKGRREKFLQYNSAYLCGNSLILHFYCSPASNYLSKCKVDAIVLMAYVSQWKRCVGTYGNLKWSITLLSVVFPSKSLLLDDSDWFGGFNVRRRLIGCCNFSNRIWTTCCSDSTSSLLHLRFNLNAAFSRHRLNGKGESVCIMWAWILSSLHLCFLLSEWVQN